MNIANILNEIAAIELKPKRKYNRTGKYRRLRIQKQRIRIAAIKKERGIL